MVFYNLISNYLMRLSKMRRIMQIGELLSLRWITVSEICTILHIIYESRIHPRSTVKKN